MNRIALSRPSIARTEASVTSPYRPSNDTAQAGKVWANSDNPLTPRPMRAKNNVVPLNPRLTEKVRTTRSEPRRVTQPAPQPVQPERAKPGLGRILTTLAGVFMCSAGVVGGLVSIAVLGVFGLAVAAGAAILGAALIKLGTRK